MFGPRIQQAARRLAESLVRPLAALGLTPNMATLIGLLLNGGVAALLALGSLRVGGVALLVAGAFDMVDGALARVRNQKTTFGAFFDSTIDRYSEGITLLGIIIYAVRQPASIAQTWVIILAYVAALGSVMVSYARARAEGLGLNLKTGLMARPERVVLLAAGLIIGAAAWLPWTLLLLAVASVFTSAQRMLDVYRLLGRSALPATSAVGAASPSGEKPESPNTVEQSKDVSPVSDSHRASQINAVKASQSN
ncbi:MAG TPA: CDP-alcohol phosphatidyltransferase family protein [Ktedonobacterales bacterium]|nr:CDP-alcohol phosphatidyltransferase family protein [Ktedonobacterales bacterium]